MMDYASGKISIVREIAYSKGEKAKVRCYGAGNHPMVGASVAVAVALEQDSPSYQISDWMQSELQPCWPSHCSAPLTRPSPQ
jgi:hypothetical protein